MHLMWLMTTVVLFISFFDDGKVKGSNLEIQVTQKLKEMIELKEHLESLQKDIEKYMSSFLNNNGLMKLNSVVQGLAQEKDIRINLGKKINSMLEAYGQQLADLATTIDNIDLHIENRLLANTNATEVSFRSKIEETVSTIEEKCTRSMSKLNQTLGNLYEKINQESVPKQVHGGWTAWGLWTRCTSTCGKGINNRVRTCTNPAPANGGNDCVGVGLEYNECQSNSCKVHGGWTAWGLWTRCTSTCGKGIHSRVRTCTNPAPANGGDDCVGVALENNECQFSSCKANGGWTFWGSWSTCSSSCGNGLLQRSRTCTNPVPAIGGQYCDGQSTEYSNCQIQPCAAPQCSDGWTKFQASCYAFIHMEMSWFAAEQYCQVFGSHLVRIDDYNELQFIQGKLYAFNKRRLNTETWYWTAGNDIMQEGHWVLTPLNVPMRYVYWAAKEPNNDYDGENCVELAYERLYQMNDNRCKLNGFFICEVDKKNG